MKKTLSSLGSRKGYTTIEMLLTITILGIILAIIDLSYDTIKAKIRYSQIKADMDGIAQAAYNDYTTNGIWGALTFAAMPPTWTASRELQRWPSPPCSGWYYSFEDWTTFPTPYPVVWVSLRRQNSTALWTYCLDTSQSSSCEMDPLNSIPTQELSTIQGAYIYCNE
jgi:prepilin-type N-terminal cleavage/methylation domain-containing protein